MKSINKMAVVAALALSSAGVASATTYHVNGSTAYRVADVSAEVAYCNANGGAFATFYGSSLTGANYSVVQNAATSPSIKFENYFNGSVAGDEALVDGVTQIHFPNATDFAPTAVTTLPSSTTAAAGGTAKSAPTDNNLLTPYSTDTTFADIAFSDVAFSTAQQIIAASTDHTTATPTGDIQVGIVPFVFVANGSSDVYSKLTGLSMDPQKFTYAWSSGASTTLSFFTGVNADEATTVYPMGRDVDSGTRATALAETGYGLNGSGLITEGVGQYFPYDTTAHQTANSATTGVIGVDTTLVNPTIAGLNVVPAESIDGYTMPAGDGGYYSGGNLATGISTAFAGTVTNTVVMTYLGVSDAKSALGATGTNRQVAVLLSYDGSTFNPLSPNPVLIYEGQYTFWSYEHLFYKGSATNLSTVASGLESWMNGTNQLDKLSSGNVTLASMNVARTGDGQNIQ